MNSAISLLLSLVVFAHEGGHGPKILGLGPHGGSMSSVIAASDVSLGERAPRSAIGEWKIKKNTLVLHLLSEEKKQAKLTKEGDLKWILLRKAQKPEVIVKKVRAGDSSFSLEISDTTGLTAVEVILPDQKKEKLVTIAFFPLPTN